MGKIVDKKVEGCRFGVETVFDEEGELAGAEALEMRVDNGAARHKGVDMERLSALALGLKLKDVAQVGDVLDGSEFGNANAEHQTHERDEEDGVVADRVEGLAADLDKALKLFARLFADHVGKLLRKHKLRLCWITWLKNVRREEEKKRRREEEMKK